MIIFFLASFSCLPFISQVYEGILWQGNEVERVKERGEMEVLSEVNGEKEDI